MRGSPRGAPADPGRTVPTSRRRQTLDALQAARTAAGRLIPVNALLSDLPAVSLTAEGLRRAANGNPLAPGHLERGQRGSGRFGQVTVSASSMRAGRRWRWPNGAPDGLLHPLVVLR